MKIKTLSLCLLFVSALACQPINSTAIEPTSVPTRSVTPAPTITSTKSIATATMVIQPTLDLITPQLIQICPSQREVPFSDLDLSTTTRLLVKKKDETTNAIWTLSKTNETLTPIAGLAPDPESYIKVQSISPDHKWLAYSTGKIGQESTALWISSMDGSVQQQILPNMNNYGNFVSWIDDGTIVIIGHPDNREEPTPVIALNPFNQEQTILPPLPEEAILLGYGVIDGQLSAIYFDGKWNLFNYSTGRTQNVFPWLEAEEWLKDYFVLKNDFYVNMVAGEIDLEIARPYGLDAMLGLTTSAGYTDYAAIMQRFVLPGENEKTRILGHNKNMIYLERYDDAQIDRQNVIFYALDVERAELRDYCFDRSDASLPIAFSGDGRFVAWPKHSNQYELIIFALETGEVALLSNVELIGWGEAEAP